MPWCHIEIASQWGLRSSYVCYLLSVICYLLSVICYLLSVICVGVWNIVLPAILVISFWEACISRWVGSE
ncbi:hypothetical protein FHG61_02685 [Xylella fastidiosa subsp. multiplex]|nr:hypothetical protein [Xylella fastidiosa subsp. multiplex]